MPNISVIIVSYNNNGYLVNCLNSLPSNVEIIVVDNNSTDKTPKIVEKEYPHVKIIKNKENVGYGKAVNLGVKKANGDYLVILNHDTIVEENTIEKLVQPLIHNDVITVPRVMCFDGSGINTCGNIEHFTGLGFTRGLGENETYHIQEQYLGGISGSCFAIKKNLYQALGGFDENIFLYMEDVEISWKINSLGFKIQYIPDAIIYHDYKLTVPAEKIYHLEKGRYKILRKYFTWKDFLMFSPSIIVTELLTFGYASLQGLSGLKYKLKAIKEGLNEDIKKRKVNKERLIRSLDWRIPSNQLNYNFIDKIIKESGNFIYYINYMLILTLFYKEPNHNKLQNNTLQIPDKRKIALVCSHGGHLTETLYLLDAFKDHEPFFITYNNFRTEDLDYNKHLIENIGTSPSKMVRAFLQIFKILFIEKPDMIVSTGSEIAIPAFIIAKIFRIQTVFIESWSRVKTRSPTGRIVYPFSDLFLVQWPELLTEYGKKAKYKGALI